MNLNIMDVPFNYRLIVLPTAIWSSVLSKFVANIFILILYEKSIPLKYSRLIEVPDHIFVTGIFLLCNTKAIVAQVGI